MRIKLSLRFGYGFSPKICALFIVKLYIIRIWWEHGCRTTHASPAKIKLNVFRACWQHSINSFHFIKTCKSVWERGKVWLISVKVSIQKIAYWKWRNIFKFVIFLLPSYIGSHPPPCNEHLFCAFTVHRNDIILGWNWAAYTHSTHHFRDIWRLFLSDGRRWDQTKSQPKLQSHFRCGSRTSNELFAVHSSFFIAYTLLTSILWHPGTRPQCTFYWLIVAVCGGGLATHMWF